MKLALTPKVFKVNLSSMIIFNTTTTTTTIFPWEVDG